MQQLIPEWEPQEAVLIAWPDRQTDWLPWLDEVRATWLELISALNQNDTPVIMLIRRMEIKPCKRMVDHFNQRLPYTAITKLLLLPADYNDTWLRDYGFLTVRKAESNQALSFNFNGWGNKFSAAKDNAANEDVFASLLQQPLQSIDFVLEGGALEVNAGGDLLSTYLCLSNPERNGVWDESKNTNIFQSLLGAKRSILLQEGFLEGDDTDGHIDTLVRFTPTNNLVIQSCNNNPLDSHYEKLTRLVNECAQYFPNATLFELPLPHIVNQENERLPASYANFLISNQYIFAPIYQEPEDEVALSILSNAFSDFSIIPINCRHLVQQFGSLHCITMQVPTNTLKPEIISLARSGVVTYE